MKSRRIDDIELYVKKHDSATIEELTKEFNVSVNTIRRDINELVARGNNNIEKVYGGIRARNDALLSFDSRHSSNYQEKLKIAQKAADLIQNDDVIFIDSGTTTAPIMKYLDRDIRCTIITNNLDIIDQMDSFSNIKLFLVGSLFRKKTRSFIAIDDEVILDRFNINKAFLAATGLSLKNGITNSDQGEYWIKKNVVNVSEKNILLVDSTKFGRSALLTYAKLDQIDIIVTDEEPSEKYADYFKAHDIEVL
ncbi:DeoR/GlpR family DNA-binding transcription regulator [Enterococcus faecium]|uniref:DeoR/GlpR family DNA-binding transcription regulator n=1 Tax=Enterococcus faecium TaxID=1352 RepID=UPI00338D5D3F